jgi:pseudouridine-5'-monophosphatase
MPYSVLSRYSAGPLDWPIKSQLQGCPIFETIKLVLARANLTQVVDPEDYIAQLYFFQEQELAKAKALLGVEKLLSDLSTAKSGLGGKIRVALVSSSDKNRFDIKTSHLDNLFGVFTQKMRVLGDDTRIPKGTGSHVRIFIYLL